MWWRRLLLFLCYRRRRGEHAAVDGDQGGLLVVAEARVGGDSLLGAPGVRLVGVRGLGGPDGHRVDQAGLGEERFRGNVERAGECLEHADGRLVQAPLDLAEVRVGQAGQLGELAERQVGALALLTDEGAKCLPLRFPRVRHGASSGLVLSTVRESPGVPGLARLRRAGAYLVLSWVPGVSELVALRTSSANLRWLARSCSAKS